MRRLLIPALALCLAATSASVHAAETKKADPDGLDVKMTPVALPVMFHHRLVNYIFVTARLLLRPGSDPVRLREKEPYFRDALVRLASRTPLNLPNDLTKINEPLLKADMMRECIPIAGPGVVTAVVIISQAPQHEAWSLPKPDPVGGAPAPERKESPMP